MSEELMRAALREIKLTCLTEKNAVSALHRITRLCIDAGIKEHLDELQAYVLIPRLALKEPGEEAHTFACGPECRCIKCEP